MLLLVGAVLLPGVLFLCGQQVHIVAGAHGHFAVLAVHLSRGEGGIVPGGEVHRAIGQQRGGVHGLIYRGGGLAEPLAGVLGVAALGAGEGVQAQIVPGADRQPATGVQLGGAQLDIVPGRQGELAAGVQLLRGEGLRAAAAD